MSKIRWIASIRHESTRPQPAMPWKRGVRAQPDGPGRDAAAAQTVARQPRPVQR